MTDTKITQGQSLNILFVIPTLGKRMASLSRTIASIQAQRGVCIDLILVTRKFSPELCSIARKHDLSLIAHDGNISAGLNTALYQASRRTRYFGWLGDDDLLRPDALLRAAIALKEQPSAVTAYGACDYISQEGVWLFTRWPKKALIFLLPIIPGLIKQESCLFKLDAVRRVGGLNEKLTYTMDLDLLLKLHQTGKFIHLNAIQAAYGCRSDSLTLAHRHDSLNEAQATQKRHSRGIWLGLYILFKYPIHLIILLFQWRLQYLISRSEKPCQ